MEIKKLNFEKKEVQIKETYIDEAGITRERIKKVLLPTGNIASNDDPRTTPSKKRGNKLPTMPVAQDKWS